MNINKNLYHFHIICAFAEKNHPFSFIGYKTNTGIKIIVGVKNNILPSDTELCKSRDETIQYFLVCSVY